jgi:hypothetical protein
VCVCEIQKLRFITFVNLGTILASAYDFRNIHLFSSKTEYIVSPVNYENELWTYIHLVTESRYLRYKHMVCIMKDKFFLRMDILATVYQIFL